MDSLTDALKEFTWQGAAAGFVITTAVLAVAGYLLWWRGQRCREVRAVVVDLRELAQDLVDQGSLRERGFTDDHRRAEHRLDDLVPQIHDRPLQRLCATYLATWQEVRASAPDAVPLVTLGDEPSPDTDWYREQREKGALQNASARSLVDQSRAVLARVTKLERYLVRRN